MDRNEQFFRDADPVICGLVVTLDDNPSLRQSAVSAIHLHPAIQVGAAKDRWLPLAAEARDTSESRMIQEWIRSLPGVQFVDVVSVSHDLTPEPAPALA